MNGACEWLNHTAADMYDITIFISTIYGLQMCSVVGYKRYLLIVTDFASDEIYLMHQSVR